jgi:hypothetical protein
MLERANGTLYLRTASIRYLIIQKIAPKHSNTIGRAIDRLVDYYSLGIVHRVRSRKSVWVKDRFVTLYGQIKII